MNGCTAMDQKIKENHEESKENRDKSGSCALFVIIKSKLQCNTVDETCYVGNIGDSRCIVSLKEGKEVKQISRDHKPNDPIEKERIMASGG